MKTVDSGDKIVVNGQSLTLPSPKDAAAGSLVGGVDGSLFDGYAAQSAANDEVNIPVWRNGSRKTVTPPNATSPDAVHDVLYTKNLSEDQAILEFANILSDPDLVKSWAQIALEAGLISPDQMHDATALGTAWQTAVGWAVKFKQASNGSVELTPFEAAQKVAQNTGSALAAKQAYAADHFTGDKTFTQESVSTVEPDVNTLHTLLGRDPTEGELAAYRHGVGAVAEAHPVTTETTTSYKDGEAVSARQVSSGGFDKQQAEVDAAHAASPEVAEFQAASTYYDALVQALGSAV
jgi:hypothetical protein